MTARKTYPPRDYPGTVDRWIDGDTAVILMDLGFNLTLKGRCRVLTIDTPEMSTGAPGAAAKAYSESFAPPGSAAVCTTHKPAPEDSFGRWLVDVKVGDVLLSGELLMKGLATTFKG